MSNETTKYWLILNDKRNVEGMSNYIGAPTSPAWFRVNADIYNKIFELFSVGKIVNYRDGGTISATDRPPPPLKDQAQSALSDIQSQAPMIVAMGGNFGPQTQAYVKALQAIINGADTASTTLPTKPDQLTE